MIGNSDIQITGEPHLVSLAKSEYDGIGLDLQRSCELSVGVAVDAELTIDYAMIDNHQDSHTGNRGSATFREVIAGQGWRRPGQQARHGRYFAWYLQVKAGLLS
ncbi:MAG TPA: hypothetical protein VNF24_00945 [Candidatus Acidoferrales bacterium]|nr:hypothetical protein [Candidatus Acidoferrales bacterium]